MNVLKIATAGSVDDGKSTLIGRLLYDTKSLTEDKLSSIANSSKKKGYDYLDFSLATDGLVAEREQGITIDVAHIYFSTPTRSYIIADTPGHVEYTRNMVTGASNATVSIILIDARKGVIEQTNRHFFINNLLRVEHIIFAVNKMDLVDFSSERFDEITSEINQLVSKSHYHSDQVTIIPISALNGDNIITQSPNISWYNGKSLLDHLEQLDINCNAHSGSARLPIQSVIRPKTEEHHDFRGFSGKLYGNDLSVGDSITVLPSGTESRVKSMHFFDKTFDVAKAGSSITLTLEDEVNISRGDMIVKSSELPRIEKELSATICWMDKEPMTVSTKYLIQRGVHVVAGKIVSVDQVFQPDFSGLNTSANALHLNDIGSVTIKLSKALVFDRYEDQKSTGTFILIHPSSNTTAGVGFID